MKRVFRVVRIVWVGGGVLFFLWLVYSMQARDVEPAVLQSNEGVTVTETARTIAFVPQSSESTGLLFYPGALVEPEAYAPLARAVAEQGFRTIIVKLPLRTASFGSQEADLMAYTLTLIAENSDVARWFVAGGNHAQFGYYGGQLGDNRAEIGREAQQDLTVAAILAALRGE